MSKIKLPIITLAFVIIGSVVGAGFASGRELMLFFNGSPKILSSIICIAFFMIIAYLLMTMSKNLDKDNLVGFCDALFIKKISLAYQFLFFLDLFLAVATMIAGANSLLCKFADISTKFSFFGFLTMLISGIILYYGLKGIKAANFIAVPMIIIFIIIISFGVAPLNVTNTVTFDKTLFKAITYVSLNGMLMSGVLISIGKSVTKKTIVYSSIISAVILGILIFLILIATNSLSLSDMDMPLVFLASRQSKPIFIFGILVVFLAIFTTLLSAAFPLINAVECYTKDKILALVVLLASGYFVSLFGFSVIVDFVYPIMGIIGSVFIVHSYINYKLILKRSCLSKIKNKQ